MVGIAVGVALLLGGIGGFALGRHRAATAPEGSVETAREPAGRPTPRPVTPSLEQQTAARRLAGWSDAVADPLAPVGGPVTTFEPVLRLAPPYDAVDATLIDALDTRVRLAQARPVGRNEVCVGEGGARLACGLKGRASLQNRLFGRSLTCLRLFLTSDERRGVVDARCSVDGQDLALHQIRAGYAFPTEHAEAEHWAALDEARRARVGVWAGPYEIPRLDHSEIDAREVPFGSLRLPPPQ